MPLANRSRKAAMADPDHLNILRQDVDAWNAWRKPDITPDLSGGDLFGRDLSGVNLSDANLREANLTRARLSGANLTGANLSRAYFIEANLSEANLSGASLFEANLSGANLSGAKLIRVNLSEASLFEANLSGANLSGAKLIRVGRALGVVLIRLRIAEINEHAVAHILGDKAAKAADGVGRRSGDTRRQSRADPRDRSASTAASNRPDRRTSPSAVLGVEDSTHFSDLRSRSASCLPSSPIIISRFSRVHPPSGCRFHSRP
jgi:uncharacterized protein YjbI with pentapeptide repeats